MTESFKYRIGYISRPCTLGNSSTYSRSYLYTFSLKNFIWFFSWLYIFAICICPIFNYLFSCHSPGIMLLIYTRTSSSVPLKILSIEDGTVLKSFSHLLHRNKKVDFIEQFNEKLLVKQEGENLQILDVSLIPKCSQTKNIRFIIRVLTLNSLVYLISIGKELPVDRSEQNWVYDSICLYLSVWAPTVPDIPESISSSLELSRWTGHIIWRSPVVAHGLQHKQHIHYKWSRSYYFILQGWLNWFIFRRKRWASFIYIVQLLLYFLLQCQLHSPGYVLLIFPCNILSLPARLCFMCFSDQTI